MQNPLTQEKRYIPIQTDGHLRKLHPIEKLRRRLVFYFETCFLVHNHF
jgi:hypothetical protein